MNKRIVLPIAIVALLAAGIAAGTRTFWWPDNAAAQAPGQGPRVFPVEVAKVVRQSVPVLIEALGTVSPMASVAIKSRVDSEIVGVHFMDGARVKEGELLFTLDSRALAAQIRQAVGVVARDKAQVEAAERDVRRYTDLVAKNATPVTNLDNARTLVDTARANIQANEAALENLRVQLSYTMIKAPIAGRISVAAAKTGNMVRPADTTPLATINQIMPVYVAFPVPQKMLPEIRIAMAEGVVPLEAMVQGETKPVIGEVTMVDNAVEIATGMVTLRATMENRNELLWPGMLVNSRLTLRTENAIVIPSHALQSGQSGKFVFVIKDGVASSRTVSVARNFEGKAVIGQGLSEDELVVTDGQLLLSNGSRVSIRERKPGA